MAGRLVVVCGLPGAGKTRLAVALEADLRAVRLSADDWMAHVGIDVFDAQARERVERLQWQVCERLLTLGQRVVVEWGSWGRAERDAMRERARALGCDVELHVVDAPLDILWARVQHRAYEQQHGARALTRDDLEACAAVFEPPDEAELALYDVPLVSPREVLPGQNAAGSG